MSYVLGNLHLLNMGSDYNCLLALLGDNTYLNVRGYFELSHEEAIRLGFVLPYITLDDYKKLTSAWKEVLTND